MSWRKIGVSSCGIGLSCLFSVRSAEADEPQASFKIGVSYQAPATCPGVSTFMMLLAEHLKSEDNAPLYAHVKISEAAPLHRLELTVYASALPLRSEEAASSCEELVRLAAFMTAVARTQPSPREWSTEPPEDEDAPNEEETRETPLVAPAPIDPREPDVAPTKAGSRWLAAGQLQGGFGVLPGVTFGTGPLVELAWQSFALRAAGSWWVPSEAAPEGGLDSLAPLTFTLQSVDLAACLRQSMYEWGAHELSFGACAVLSGHRLGTESRQSGGSSDVAYRAGGGLSVGATWALPGELEVGAELGLSELSAPFRVQAAPLRESIYESRGSQARFALFVGFRFGGGG